jgi:hypothetical protein
LLGSLGFNFYLYNKIGNQSLSTKNAQDIVGMVGKLMLLPPDEMPTIATVSNPEKLKDQPFFSRAQYGDKVLIYTKSAKAILWRPETGQIIEVFPINISKDLVQ